MPETGPRPAIAILGCGLIGTSWAAMFLAAGHDVRAWDPDAARREALASGVERPLAQIAELGRADAPRGTLTVHGVRAEAVAGVALIQENAPENVALKHTLYAEIEAIPGCDATIASSSSAHGWTTLSEGMADPSRLITAHPFNPPHLVPLVEIYGTDAERVAQAEALYRGLGSVPARLKKPATGHIANRLASALWREAVHIVAEGIADVEAVDAALVNGPGMRWSVLGAHMAYHLGGGEGGIEGYLAHLGPSQEARWASLGAPSLTPEVRAKLIEGVAREAAGRSVAELEAERDAKLIALRRMMEDRTHA